ncbi:MAG: hypothetical protein NUV65_06870 [Candidatus Roizmanbacteria bacterium]|nr:hypothetical protein [Candidatus Roizmanbacteria bacterium]
MKTYKLSYYQIEGDIPVSPALSIKTSICAGSPESAIKSIVGKSAKIELWNVDGKIEMYHVQVNAYVYVFYCHVK